MAWNPGNLIRQPDDTLAQSQIGDKTRTIVWKGSRTDVELAIASLNMGEEIESGWALSAYDRRYVPGNLAILSLHLSESSATTSGGEGGEGDNTPAPLRDIWSIKSVRNDVSIMAFCGPSPGSNPQRALIEAWMKEPDGELAEALRFTKSDGSVFEITEQPTLDLIEKIRKGVEAVIRFYPVVTRTRTYATVPPACMERLGFIDTPPAPAGTAKSPSGLAAAVTAHQWLKVQDDAQEQQDGKWTRTEAWMGIAVSDSATSPWDEDLYGANRWSMPYQAN